MDNTNIQTILTSVTAILAIAAPTVATIITTISNARTKKYEMYMPKVQAAAKRMADAYAKLNRLDCLSGDVNLLDPPIPENNNDLIQDFFAAAYEVMFLVADHSIRKDIIELLGSFQFYKLVSGNQDELLQRISGKLARKITPGLRK